MEYNLEYYGYPSFESILEQEKAKVTEHTTIREVAQEVVDYYLNQYNVLVYIDIAKGNSINDSEYKLTKFIDIHNANSIDCYWK
jgi:hypothetical protein